MQDSDNGYIQVPRSHPVWSFSAVDFRVAFEVIRRATHKDISFRHLGQDIQLKRGQLFISERQLARDCGLARTTLRRCFERLKCVRFCVQSCVHLGFVVTVCDYNLFNNCRYPDASTSAPTSASNVVAKRYQGGSATIPPIYNEQGTKKINNSNDSDIKDKEYIEPTGRKPLTFDNFDKTEIPGLLAMFCTPIKVADHLKNRGFIEEAIQKIVNETFNEPKKGGPLNESLRNL